MFSVLYTIRDNKGNRKDHVDQEEEDKQKKFTHHYHPVARKDLKDLGRPCKNWQQSCKMLGGLRHDRKTKSKLIIKMTCKLINHLLWINFILNFWLHEYHHKIGQLKCTQTHTHTHIFSFKLLTRIIFSCGSRWQDILNVNFVLHKLYYFKTVKQVCMCGQSAKYLWGHALRLWEWYDAAHLSHWNTHWNL